MVFHELTAALALTATVGMTTPNLPDQPRTGYSCDQACHPADFFCRAYQRMFCPPTVPDGLTDVPAAPAKQEG